MDATFLWLAVASAIVPEEHNVLLIRNTRVWPTYVQSAPVRLDSIDGWYRTLWSVE